MDYWGGGGGAGVCCPPPLKLLGAWHPPSSYAYASRIKALVESIDITCARYKMKISAENTKLMTNSVNDTQREIKVKGRSWVL